jgi:electron transfer flavoprotein alpha/beta subunit
MCPLFRIQPQGKCPAATGKSSTKTEVMYIVNPYDKFALEEGLRLREKNVALLQLLQ